MEEGLVRPGSVWKDMRLGREMAQMSPVCAVQFLFRARGSRNLDSPDPYDIPTSK